MYERSSYNKLSPDGEWMLFAVDVMKVRIFQFKTERFLKFVL